MITWLIGLSGSGKTTIGKELYKLWRAEMPNTVFVDADEIRKIFQHDDAGRAYTIDGRRQNAQRISELCLWLDRQDINVVCCILSIFPEMRQIYRGAYSSYFEVYVSTPLNVLEKRDTKGLYRAAKRKETDNIVGLHITFPEPEDADLVVDGSGKSGTPEIIAQKILDHTIAKK